MKTALLALVVLLTQLVEAVTGFGSTVMAMPFTALLIGLQEGVRLLVTLTFLMCGAIGWKERRHVQWRVLGGMLLWIGLGMPLGMWLFTSLDDRVLKRILGGFTILIALWGLFAPQANRANAPSGRVRAAGLKAALFAGGILHGAFGSGGPLIVLYASRTLLEKRGFRATMCLNWTVLNALHLARYTANGEWTASTGILILAMLPVLALSVFLGERVVRRLSGKEFMKTVYLVLLGSGIFMFI